MISFNKPLNNQRFSDVFRGYRQRPVAWNESIYEICGWWFKRFEMGFIFSVFFSGNHQGKGKTFQAKFNLRFLDHEYCACKHSKGFGPKYKSFFLGSTAYVLTFCSDYYLHRSVDKQIGTHFQHVFGHFFRVWGRWIFWGGSSIFVYMD